MKMELKEYENVPSEINDITFYISPEDELRNNVFGYYLHLVLKGHDIDDKLKTDETEFWFSGQSVLWYNKDHKIQEINTGNLENMKVCDFWEIDNFSYLDDKLF
jgi:hypothetical protein